MLDIALPVDFSEQASGAPDHGVRRGHVEAGTLGDLEQRPCFGEHSLGGRLVADLELDGRALDPEIDRHLRAAPSHQRQALGDEQTARSRS